MHYTLCDMFSDLTQNSIEAGADTITVDIEQTETSVSCCIEDNGKGMSPEQLKRATDPFYTDGIKHPHRKVGLGIPFLIQTAEETGGTWSITSDVTDNGKGAPGTRISCSFDLTNIDTPPVGDVTGFFRQILTFPGSYEMIITREAPGFGYTVRRSDLLEALGLQDQGEFADANALSLLGQYLESLED
ncbi:sensor histidine kinase [Brucepastera parasyntrophica]|uniref:ATP-binding protein n=1 Tax=Brucepastera parasyntrophica TaxID=2880008 RepID=UPI002109618C|nr:sensor histidine kinase [Brucepastera parasyntrophica]ULQ58948.1 sensor histidine kinase [Brucepastera parasyntrophica]